MPRAIAAGFLGRLCDDERAPFPSAGGTSAAHATAASLAEGKAISLSRGAVGGGRHASALAGRAQGEADRDDADGQRDGNSDAGPEARQTRRRGRARANGLADAAEEVIRHFVRCDGVDGAEHGAQVGHLGCAARTPGEVGFDANARGPGQSAVSVLGEPLSKSLAFSVRNTTHSAPAG
jgi:hypothetical protein